MALEGEGKRKGNARKSIILKCITFRQVEDVMIHTECC
jgi:hypothetical protein